MSVNRMRPRRASWSRVWSVLLLLGCAAGTVPAQGPSATHPTETARLATGREPSRNLEHRLLLDIEASVARVEPWLQRYGYWALFAAVGVEGFGLPTPGQTILEAGSAASASPDSRLRIGWILLVAFLAASVGNTLGYLIGYSGGRELLQRLHVDQRHLDKMEDGFDRYGGWLIVFARFFDGPRQLNGIAAGILGMPWIRFTFYNLAGAALWACFWGLGVYYLDLNLDQVVAFVRHINPWVATVTLIGLGLAAALLLSRLPRRGKGNP